MLSVALPARVATAATPLATGSVTFGTPTATSRFGIGVDFAQPVTTSGLQPRRIELLITMPGDLGPEVKELANVGDLTSTTLQYSLKESDQHIYPNTKITARWRIVDGDGAAYEGPSISLVYADTRFDWKTVSGPVVRVHWYVGNDAFGQRALAIGESGVDKAEALLGVTETEPVDFYIYADQAAFYDALGPGTRENVGGEALADIRTLFALIPPDAINDAWVGIVIPHELTHLVFNTAVDNPYHFPPRWLNEGLAVYLSQGYDASDKGQVSAAARDGSIIPLTGLVGQFPTTRDRFSLAYAESVSAVDFIIRTFGTDALVQLILAYAGGVTDDEAFTQAIGLDSAALDAAWLADIGAATPVAHGPQPDPAGPLPAGWSSTQEQAAPGPSATASVGSIAGVHRVVHRVGPGVALQRAVPVAGAIGNPDGRGSSLQPTAVGRRNARPGRTRHSAGPGWPADPRRSTGRCRDPAGRACSHVCPPAPSESRAVIRLSDRVRRIPSWQITLGVALLVLGFLVAAQLRSEAPRVQYTSQERQPLVGTALGLQAQQDQLKDRILELRGQIQDLEQQGQGNAALVEETNRELDEARMAAGLVALKGSGLVLQLQDSTNPVQPGDNQSDYLVSANDVRVLVQELWLAGAEAVAVNGERVTASTAILDIGGSVLVNSAYLAPPYQVSAIGDDGLYDRLSHTEGFRDLVRTRAEAFGIRISFAELADVVVPAYAGNVILRYARAVQASPSPSPSAPSAAPASPSPAATRRPAATPTKRPGSSPRPTARPSATP